MWCATLTSPSSRPTRPSCGPPPLLPAKACCAARPLCACTTGSDQLSPALLVQDHSMPLYPSAVALSLIPAKPVRSRRMRCCPCRCAVPRFASVPAPHPPDRRRRAAILYAHRPPPDDSGFLAYVNAPVGRVRAQTRRRAPRLRSLTSPDETPSRDFRLPAVPSPCRHTSRARQRQAPVRAAVRRGGTAPEQLNTADVRDRRRVHRLRHMQVGKASDAATVQDGHRVAGANPNHGADRPNRHAHPTAQRAGRIRLRRCALLANPPPRPRRSRCTRQRRCASCSSTAA